MFASVLAPQFFIPRNWAASDVGTPAAIGEALLRAYTVPANFFATVGRRINFRFWGFFANNANNKQVRIRLGPVTLTGQIILTQSIAPYQNLTWDITGTVRVRVLPDSQSCEATSLITGGTVAQAIQMGRATAVNDDASAMFLECTGINANASANDVVCSGFEITQVVGSPETAG